MNPNPGTKVHQTPHADNTAQQTRGSLENLGLGNFTICAVKGYVPYSKTGPASILPKMASRDQLTLISSLENPAAYDPLAC